MADSRSRDGKSGRKGKPPAGGWIKLTWDDLETWAGSRTVSRGRAYQRGGHVKDLRISGEGDLLATVVGGDRYATTVSLTPGAKGGTLRSTCTCPVGISCKHAVATIADYLQAVADGREVPRAAEDDPRWERLDEEGDRYDEDEDDPWDDEDEEPPARRLRMSGRKSRAGGSATNWDERIERHIRGKTQGELADLVWSLTRRFPEVYREFRERIVLQGGNVGRLLAEARAEIRRVTSQPAWSDRWNNVGHIPNYGPIRQRFERLLELGHADEVVSLGREFLEKGLEQVGEAHDEEGETASAFSECLPVIFQAVMASCLTPPERILFAIDAEGADDFDATGEATALVLDAPWKPDDWSAVADTLAGRLAGTTDGGASKAPGSLRDYHRDRLTNWIAHALQGAGRDDEVGTLYESEARATGSYERLVNHLLEARRFEDAERWAKDGIAATWKALPGISAHLVEKLAEVARNRKRWDVVAAHAAWRFFDRPGPSSFDDLMKSASKAGVEAKVREMALRFLETGVGPFRASPPPAPVKPPPRGKVAPKRKSAASPRAPSPPAGPGLKVDPAWPLPLPDYLIPLIERRPAYDPGPRPHVEVLLEMAIAAKNLDEVLRWFDAMRLTPQRPGHYNHAITYADRVADAVSASHPDRTLEIYRLALDSQLPNASASAYKNAAGYLRKLRPVYKALGRAGEWDALLASIREKYQNRPRFMEILDRLDGRTIIDSAKPRRS